MEAAQELGATHKRMVSRAYHDSLFMSQAPPFSLAGRALPAGLRGEHSAGLDARRTPACAIAV